MLRVTVGGGVLGLCLSLPPSPGMGGGGAVDDVGHEDVPFDLSYGQVVAFPFLDLRTAQDDRRGGFGGFPA